MVKILVDGRLTLSLTVQQCYYQYTHYSDVPILRTWSVAAKRCPKSHLYTFKTGFKILRTGTEFKFRPFVDALMEIQATIFSLFCPLPISTQSFPVPNNIHPVCQGSASLIIHFAKRSIENHSGAPTCENFAFLMFFIFT